MFSTRVMVGQAKEFEPHSVAMGKQWGVFSAGVGWAGLQQHLRRWTEVRETSWEVVCAGAQELSQQRCGDLN